MRKVVNVLQVLLDSRIGGPQRRALLLASKLSDYGIVTKFCVPRREGDLHVLVRAEGFKVFPVLPNLPRRPTTLPGALSCFRWLSSIPRVVGRLCKLMNSEQIDIVHVNGYLGWHAVLAAKQQSIPVVFHVMGTLYPKWLIRVTQPIWASPAAVIIATAERVRDYYLGSRLTKKSVVMYDPVDTSHFDPLNFDRLSMMKVKEELGISPNDKVIISVGNINPAKGYEHLVDAAHYVVYRRKINVRFFIIGSFLESQLKYLRTLKAKIQSLGLKNYVNFVGAKSDVAPFLAIADLFVSSSVTEGTPMAILEAMAMGIPVIACEVGAIHELLGGNERGTLVPPRDPVALGEAIITLLLDDKHRYEIGRRARNWVLGHCSLEMYAKQLACLYKTLSMKNSKEPKVMP